MKKKLNLFFPVIVFIVLHLNTKAQEVALFTQAIRSQEVLNPSFNAFKRNISALMIYRNQWVGVDYSPQIIATNLDIIFIEVITI